MSADPPDPDLEALAIALYADFPVGHVSRQIEEWDSLAPDERERFRKRARRIQASVRSLTRATTYTTVESGLRVRVIVREAMPKGLILLVNESNGATTTEVVGS